MKFACGLSFITLVVVSGCAHGRSDTVTREEAARLDRKLVREAVVFEQGTKDGAVVPEVSAPRLRAVWIPEHLDDNGARLVEAHREWLLEGDVVLLGTPQPKKSENK